MGEMEIVCEVCPAGCLVRAIFENAELIEATGNRCEKGEQFVMQEIEDPLRILTTTVKVRNGELEVVPVKTDRSIARNILFKAAELLAGIRLEAPVEAGQVVVENLLSTGARVITTKRIARVS